MWSVMREESGFRPSVQSMTGAIGLLQIQPTTGSRLAQELGVDPFVAEDLADPGTNVRFGAYYLHQLSALYGGSLAPAIASYNAGPDAVGGWIDGADESTEYAIANPAVYSVLPLRRLLHDAGRARRGPLASGVCGGGGPQSGRRRGQSPPHVLARG